jgi:hypothetical protein
MRKILFILNYRSGTNLWLFTNGKKRVNFTASPQMSEIKGGKPLINPEVDECIPSVKGWSGSRNSFFLPTKSPKVCPIEQALAVDGNIDKVLSDPPPFDYFAWYTHMGDWWGEAKSKDVPEPYDVETPVRYGPSEIRNLPGEDWKVIHLIRDGRNQIESLLNIPGGYEEGKFKEDPNDYFEVLCKGFRNRSRMALDCLYSLPNFRLFKFEDFMTSPVDILSRMYLFAGLKIDEAFVTNAYNLTLKRKVYKQHSSFGSFKNIHSRWKEWSSRKKSVFKEIAGKELIELGYESNLDW